MNFINSEKEIISSSGIYNDQHRRIHREIVEEIISGIINNVDTTNATIDDPSLQIEPIIGVMETYEEREIQITTDIRQLCSKQDYIWTGKNLVDHNGETILEMIALFDGHGSDHVIEKIRSLDLNKIVAEFAEPEHEIQRLIQETNLAKKFSVYSARRSGATCSIIKVYKNRIECRHVGDSEISVYKNKKIAYRMNPHTTSNSSELRRIWKLNASLHEGNKPKILSAVEIIMEPSNIVKFKNFPLAPTQSLGHNGETGIIPFVEIIEYTKDDIMDCIVASDGVWDMIMHKEEEEIILNMEAEQIGKFCEDRWKQTWIYEKETTTFPSDGYDDISVAVIRIR